MMDGEDLEIFSRSLTQAVGASTGETLDAALDEVGWRDALDLDPHNAISLLFELQGRVNATSAALDLVMTRAMRAGASWVHSADGAAFVLPPLGATSAPARRGPDGLDVRGVATRAVLTAPATLVVSVDDGALAVTTVPTEQLSARTIRGLDPRLGLVEVTGSGVSGPAESPPPDSWAVAVAAGQLAVAHELLGASRTMLQLACDHAIDRIQFGGPIAGFQAIRHRLADAFVAAESADAAIAAAWDVGDALSPVAKAVAGRSARLVAKHAQQVLAGIGFTTEHDLHLHVRRVLVLDSLLGDARSLTRSMGDELIRSRRLPPMPTL